MLHDCWARVEVMAVFDLVYALLAAGFLISCLWLLYNVPIAAVGVRQLRKSRRKSAEEKMAPDRLPVFSVVIPAKNEEKVIGRLLDALSRLNYPRDKVEVIVVEDGSTDGTVGICRGFADRLLNFKILQKTVSDGKPSALNLGIEHATGEIVGFFDADSVPDKDVLLRAASYFQSADVVAVQGRTHSINSDENMLTRMLSHEETVWFEAYLRGRDVLKLFVHLKGSCQFVRRQVLEELNGFDESVLSEDMEISAKLAENGYGIRYAPDVVSWQESPASWKQLFKQRVRWFRGCVEVGLKYGSLMRKPGRRTLDAETTFFGPLTLILSLASYLAAFGAVLVPFSLSPVVQFVMNLAALAFTGTLILCGLALIYASRPRRLRSLLWVPFLYVYWNVQAFMAVYAVFCIVFRRRRVWTKTEKSGVIATGKQDALNAVR
jgi:cellulose synthase/poly-beta-1,6-N-acetylglucosamine synthase-like glycosyltransferase